MKKSVLILTVIALMVTVFATAALAAEKEESPQWFKDMLQWKKEQVEEAVKDGTITAEDAKLFYERFDAMEKYHEENGFTMNGMGFGSCRGGLFNKAGGRGGFSGGMMNRFNLSNQ
ncbi:DUF2680 domain-containing protein [Geosporobacter ferrireducens]|uniref:DUF2680 domain-containing protein n=1 Tax=Geosporobacter ferrireducens TaxID=1424294 RepID=UPI00139BEAB4|nr:DUF2680 domain-containing protein [Geosporobacter ferrireducens]MTI55464.1 DUF2680 domain-containing protein [Geosporobacter ferrireducens]